MITPRTTPDSPVSCYGVFASCLAANRPGSTIVLKRLQGSTRPPRSPHCSTACGGEVTIRKLPWHGGDLGSGAFNRLDSAMLVLDDLPGLAAHERHQGHRHPPRAAHGLPPTAQFLAPEQCRHGHADPAGRRAGDGPASAERRPYPH